MNTKKKKILIIRLGAIGDVVHTTIIPTAIKQKHPDYEVHYLTQMAISPLLKNNPNIDKIIPWERKQRKSLGYTLKMANLLRKEKYDIIFNLTVAIRNIFLSVMAMPKKIVNKKCFNKSWVEDYFYTAKSVLPDIEQPDRLYLFPDKESLEKIEKDIKDLPKPYIAILPGGWTDNRRQGRVWNLDNWKQLTDELISLYGGTVFVLGNKKERDFHEVLKNENVVIKTGDYSIVESSALLSKSDIVISGDTGPVHIASAHNVPTISLLGSTSPDKIKPYGKNGHYVSAEAGCKYCWKKVCKYTKHGEKYTPCMENITPDMIINKIKTENIL